jgi:hypothetical protein
MLPPPEMIALTFSAGEVRACLGLDGGADYEPGNAVIRAAGGEKHTMNEHPDPGSTPQGPPAPEQTDNDTAQRAAQAEDPTSPERGFEDAEDQDAEQQTN